MRHVFDCWTFSYLHTSQSNLGESWRLCSSRLESYGSTYHPSGTVFARSWAEMILERRASEPNPSSMRIGHSGTRRSSAAVRHHPTTPPTRPPKTTGISAPEKYHHFFFKGEKKTTQTSNYWVSQMLVFGGGPTVVGFAPQRTLLQFSCFT